MGYRFLLLIAALLVGCAPSASSSSVAFTPSTPAPLPAVAVSTVSGEAVSVASVAAGRVALVSLWATWCAACLRETDALNRLDARVGREATVIAIAVGEQRAAVGEFAKQRGLRYTQLVDEGFAFADAVGQRRVPATLVVDRGGQIVYRGDALDRDALEALKRALAQGAEGAASAAQGVSSEAGPPKMKTPSLGTW